MDDNKIKRKKQKGVREDGRVQVSLVVGRKPDGSPARKWFYGKTRTEANAKRDEYKMKLRMGVVQDEKITVGEWVDTCLSLYRKKVNDAYVDNDSVPYKRLKRALGRMRVVDVREADLQKELDTVEGMSFSTVSKYYYAIQLVFSKARKNKIIHDDPSEDLVLPNNEKGSHRALERWESDCIMSNWCEHRCGTWAMIMLLAGLRRSEMMALDWNAIDMTSREIDVRQVAIFKSNTTRIEERTKSEAGRRILPICQPLWDALNSVPVEKRHGLVCTSSSGELLTKSAYKRGWEGFNLAMQRIMNGEPVVQQGRRETLEKKIEDASNRGRQYILFDIDAHDLRHTFSTALYDAGVDVKAAQYYLGHSDIRMTLDLYTHLSKERENKKRIQLVEFLDGWLKKEVTDISFFDPESNVIDFSRHQKKTS